MNGTFMFSVSADVRRNAGVAGGDEVDVEIVLDTEPREVSVPADLRTALDADPEASRLFESLSFSHRSAYVLGSTPPRRTRPGSGAPSASHAPAAPGR